MSKKRLKQDYTADFRDYGEVTIPKGTLVTHETAMGFDKKYHFVDDFDWIKNSYPDYWNTLKMDMETYGFDVPKEYIERS